MNRSRIDLAGTFWMKENFLGFSTCMSEKGPYFNTVTAFEKNLGKLVTYQMTTGKVISKIDVGGKHDLKGF